MRDIIIKKIKYKRLNLKKEKYYCRGKRDKFNFQVKSKCFSNYQNPDFKEIFFQGKITYNNCKLKDSDENNNTNDKTESFLTEKILEFIEEFEQNTLAYDDFLILKIPNFLLLKSEFNYDSIIINYKKTRKRAVPYVKGYQLSRSFKKWISNNHPDLFNLFNKIDEKYEILQFVIYSLLMESNESIRYRKSLKEISEEIGVSRWSITQTAFILDELGILDFKEKFGLDIVKNKSKILQKRALGIFAHQAINNLLTKYFSDVLHEMYFSEPYILLPSSTKHPDGLFILKDLDNSIKNVFVEEFLGNFDYVIIDYTFFSLKRTINKLKKYFPSKNVLLLVVCYDIKHERILFRDIFFPDNVKIISFQFLAKLLLLDFPENKSYFDALKKIQSCIKSIDFIEIHNTLNKLSTTLYNTNDLMNYLGTGYLSKIFYKEYNLEIAKKHFITLIKREFEILNGKLNLPKNCVLLFNKVLNYLIELDEISILKDHLSYVGALTYLSSRFLFLPNITQKFIASNLGISRHGMKLRIKDIKKYDSFFLELIYPFSLNELLIYFNINNSECYNIALEILNIAHYKIFSEQEEINFALPLTAIYLAANNLGIAITQEAIIDKVKYEYRTVIFNIISKFREFSDTFEKIGIDLNDPIKEKENRILKALLNFEELTQIQIRDIIKLEPIIHLNKLIQKGLIKKNNNIYKLIKQGRIISSFEEFFEFYKNYQKSQKYSSNECYYSVFPYVSKGTIRGWISRAKDLLE